MNPGYIGRQELPQDLKALFRNITVVVPDLQMICENMLMAEGFTTAEMLAKKFFTLYNLCKDLLSKAAHYDWGLRAIKSVLVVAGNMKREDAHLPEDSVLMRALRDFNTPKIIAADMPVFLDLL
jgi:dynein heavy chain